MPTKIKDIVLAAGTAVSNSGSPDITLQLSGQPSADDTITFGDTEYTFVAGSPGAGEIQIGANLGETLDNIRTTVNAGAEGALITLTDDDTDTITVTYDTTGVEGNAYEISWVLAAETIAPDGGTAVGTGSDTLDGGTVALTNGMGSHPIELWGDGSIRFTTSGGQMISIRDVQLNKLLAEIVKENDFGVGADFAFFGTQA